MKSEPVKASNGLEDKTLMTGSGDFRIFKKALLEYEKRWTKDDGNSRDEPKELQEVESENHKRGRTEHHRGSNLDERREGGWRMPDSRHTVTVNR